jgi:hypothetical protein
MKSDVRWSLTILFQEQQPAPVRAGDTLASKQFFFLFHGLAVGVERDKFAF